jgi:hypothetical protein
MTVGMLRKLLAPYEDAMTIIVTGPCLDDDGDEAEAWFSLQDVNVKMDADTGEEYARFGCTRLDNYEPNDADG